MSLVPIARQLSREVAELRFGSPVACVYNPLDYAWAAHREYLERYARPGIEALFVGMNPGPFGMVQTGVPFGEVAAARDFLGIDAKIKRPDAEHPKRPIEGFACTRSEVSGRRVWNWVRDRFGSADAFFDRFFVWNWCPLAFLVDSGANLTPDKLTLRERAKLEPLCDAALRDVVATLRPSVVVGFGGFAAKRATIALGSVTGKANFPRIGSVLHPSPASPAANRGWAPAVERGLHELGIELPAPSCAALKR
ncbi:MAG: single-stranded DNA-binding protein [Phycisphaerae bacterium]|nr:single-stranded DNA-binding protein [Phycisphaerae bacterium]